MESQRSEGMMKRIGRAVWLPVAGISVTLLALGTVESIGNPSSLHSLKVAERARQAAEERRQAELEQRLGPAGPILDAGALARGQFLFTKSCAACHGDGGQGVPAVGGKDLVHSAFVTARTDDELAAFIIRGRAMTDPLNTTRVPMPGRGGNPNLTDAHVADIVAYLRGVQDPRRMPATPLPVVVLEAPAAPEADAPVIAVAPPTAVPQAPAALDPEAVQRGKRAYLSCFACHGQDGAGVEGIGKDLIHSPFTLSATDEQLVEFIKVGRTANDPANTTGMPMLPRGGNPALKDDQIHDIVIYLRSLQQRAGAKTDAAS